jgi:hypothetical protein
LAGVLPQRATDRSALFALLSAFRVMLFGLLRRYLNTRVIASTVEQQICSYSLIGKAGTPLEQELFMQDPCLKNLSPANSRHVLSFMLSRGLASS